LRQTAPGVLGGEQLFAARSATSLMPSQLAVGDFDSDNFPEVVTAYSDGFSFLRQNGTQLPTLAQAWVRDMQPANVTFGNPSSTAPVVTFGRAIDGTTVTPANVRLVDKTGAAVASVVSYNAGTNAATITPNAPLLDGPYVVRIDGVHDPAGESLDAFELHFTVGPKPDVTPPQTTITAAPIANTTSTHPSVTFTSSEGGSAFECSFDNGAYHVCTSPFTTTVGVGAHSLRVFARDSAGNEDATPAAESWHVWPVPHGYWMVGRDGAVYPFGTVVNFGRAHTSAAVDVEAATTGLGYWIVDATGRVVATGDAKWFGNAPALAAGETVTSLSRTATGRGYWLFTTRGRVLPFGDAQFYGDMHNVKLNGPVLDSVSTASGHGYYMVGSDGGVFSFGNAKFYGSTGGMHLNSPVRSLVPDADGVGYWLVAADGGVFAFQAPFRGSMGGAHLNRPIVGMVRFGNGYLMVASDGGVFDFSNKPFYGSLGGHPPAAPIVSIASRD
jgi:hypothetical protein